MILRNMYLLQSTILQLLVVIFVVLVELHEVRSTIRGDPRLDASHSRIRYLRDRDYVIISILLVQSPNQREEMVAPFVSNIHGNTSSLISHVSY